MESNIQDSNMTWFPTADDALFVCSPSGRVLFMTSTLRSQLDQDLVGRSLNDLLPDTLAAQLVAAAHAGNSHNFNTTLCGQSVRCAMEPREGNLLLTVFFVNTGTAPAMALTAAQLLSRELNGTISTMFAACDSLPPAEDPHTQYAKQVLNQQLHRLTRLSENLLDCVRAENNQLALQLTPSDLTAFCKNMSAQMEPVLQQQGLPCEWDLPQEPIPCEFDQSKILRVIYNLFSNAMKYTRQGNHLRFSLGVKGESAVLTLADRGAGISAEVLPHVFSKHKSGSPTMGLMVGGAGYGFALAQAILSLHGGTCVISSVEGQGTTVTMTLPLTLRGDSLPLRAPQPLYASGFDPLLLELSSALPAEFY